MIKLLHLIKLFTAVAVILFVAQTANGKTLRAYVGSVIKAPMDESLELFREETGTTVYVEYGGSGKLLSHIILSKRGDLYIPASPDFLRKAQDKGVLVKDSVIRLAYIIPAIIVQRGNPQGITGLKSLGRRGLRVAIPNPKTVSSGIYAVELLEANSLVEKIKPNIVTYSESYQMAVNLVALKAVDAAIGWKQIPPWAEKKLDVVPLRRGEIRRIAFVSAAAIGLGRNRGLTDRLLDFLGSDKIKSIFKKHGFPISEQAMRKFAPGATVGGEYLLPAGW